MSRIHPSARASSFTESVIREMTRLADVHDAINLAQGFPDFPAPAALKDAAAKAIAEDHNQYSITWGSRELRNAIAATYARDYGMVVDPETEICVTCGSTEAMISSFLGVLDPDDEVMVFEPFYENYAPDAIIAGASLRYVPLHPPAWSFDPDELHAAVGPRTRAIVLNSPHNPTGKVFYREELAEIVALCVERDLLVFTDEIYEHITYDGREHVPIATMPGMRDRVVTISALSKSYSVTGWRVGWAIASATLMAGLRAVHVFLTVAAPTPLQVAGVAALGLPVEERARGVEAYAERRALMMETLRVVGLEAVEPQGAYYVMADVSGLGLGDDVATAERLVREAKVATVPGSSFVSRPADGRHLVRFAFCKRLDTLELAAQRLIAFLA